jgi:hypothetical protein
MRRAFLLILRARLSPPATAAAPPFSAPMFAGGGALDLSEPDQPLLAGSGKPTRNELLAEDCLRAADVAAGELTLAKAGPA